VSFTPQPSTAELAHRLGASAHVCAVVSTTPIAPHVREVVLQGNARELVGQPGQDVTVRVESPDGHYLRRRYSVRALDDEADRFSLWVTTGHEGPGSHWATTAIPGDHLDVVGPRGKILLDDGADWHLFVGDTSALAAAYRLAGSIEPPGQALFVIEVDDPDDALTTTFDEGLAVTGVFVERAGRAPGDPTGVLRALAAVEFPPGADLVGHAYLFGEFSVMRRAKAALLDRGMTEDRIDLKAYWRSGRANQDHGEPDKG
jgi:NADPH-dependent ferric siderophore reductase